MAGFLGALLLTIAAAILNPQRQLLPWVLTALVLYLVVVGVTMVVNVPLNDAIKAAGEPDQIADLAQVRHNFDEARWAACNLVRTIATTAAFGCLCWALMVRGQFR
jgi:uncharacterized membrane protein